MTQIFALLHMSDVPHTGNRLNKNGNSFSIDGSSLQNNLAISPSSMNYFKMCKITAPIKTFLNAYYTTVGLRIGV